MPYKEIFAVWSETHKIHTRIQKVEFFNATSGRTYNNLLGSQRHLMDNNRNPYTYIKFCLVFFILVRFTGLK